MKTIEITRASLEALIADEAKWYARATDLEAANARLRDEIQGVVQARNSYRSQLETLSRQRDQDVEDLREALTQAVTAENAMEREAARKRGNEALVRTVSCPF